MRMRVEFYQESMTTLKHSLKWRLLHFNFQSFKHYKSCLEKISQMTLTQREKEIRLVIWFITWMKHILEVKQ